MAFSDYYPIPQGGTHSVRIDRMEILHTFHRSYGNQHSYHILHVPRSELKPNTLAVWRVLSGKSLEQANQCDKTKGLSLEEVGEIFGDEVILHITHITDVERAKLDTAIGLQKEQQSVEEIERVSQR